MGLNLKDVAVSEEISFSDLRGKKLAVDAYNTIYQFLSTIRQYDGTPLMDSKGRITSHLSGILYRNLRLFEENITPVYVFDGKPLGLKTGEIDERNERRDKARKKYEDAKKRGDAEEALKYSKRAAKIKESHVTSAKKLLSLMGINYLTAPHDAEAECAHLSKRGVVFAVSSQDWDCVLFGAPFLVRNLAISGRKKVPRKDEYYTVSPELVKLEKMLSELGITHDQLINMALLIGTDFNDGIKGIGPKTALKVVKEGKFGKYREKIKNYEKLFQIFKNPETTEFTYTPKKPDIDGLKDYLLDYDFSEKRVDSALSRVEEALKEKQSSISSFF